MATYHGQRSRYLVALLAAALAATHGVAALRAVTADVAGLAASVAGLGVLRAVGALSAWEWLARCSGGVPNDLIELTDVTLATAVVAVP